LVSEPELTIETGICTLHNRNGQQLRRLMISDSDNAGKRAQAMKRYQ